MGTCLHGGHCTEHCPMRVYAATGGALPLPVLEAPSWTRPCPTTFYSAPLHPTTAHCLQEPTLLPTWEAYGVSRGWATLAALGGYMGHVWVHVIFKLHVPSAHVELDESWFGTILSLKSFSNSKTARWFTSDVIIKYRFLLYF